MAHYQNGRPVYYGQDSNSAAASTQPLSPTRYDLYTPQQDPAQLRRIPSYVAGDDGGLLDNSRMYNSKAADGNARYAVMGAGHGGYTIANGGHDVNREPGYTQMPSANPSYVSPSRASSKGSAPSTYPYQFSPSIPAASPTQSVYNPQQYVRPQSVPQQQLSYSSLACTSPTASQAHHPYNPAAYQPASVPSFRPPSAQRQADFTSLYGQHPPTQQPYGYPSQVPPPPPPRGPDHPYGSRPSPQDPSSPDRHYGFPTPQTSSTSMSPTTLAYNPAPPVASSAAYVTGNSTVSPGSLASPHYSRGSQPPVYIPQSPHREPAVASSFDEQPPEPPVHSAQLNDSYDSYGKRLSVSRPTSGRSLPTPPTQQNQLPFPPRRTDTLTRHPQSRPLPGPPIESEQPDSIPVTGLNGIGKPGYRPEEELGYDELMKEVEAAVLNTHPTTARRHSSRSSRADQQAPIQEADEPVLFDPSTGLRLSPDERHAHTNGNMATGTGEYVNYDAYSDDSDAEAAAGLAMLQKADEDDKAEARRLHGRSRGETNASSIVSGYGSHASATAATPNDEFQDEADYIGHDLALYGGGYEGRLHYGDELEPGHDEYSEGLPSRDRLAATSGSFRSSNFSSDGRGTQSDDYDYPVMPRGSFHRSYQPPSHARVDAGGTGGLAEPGTFSRRMSFDYGDEQEDTLARQHDSNRSGSESSEMAEPGDLFFHPGMRPLPPAPVEPANNPSLIPHLMPAGTYRQQERGDLQNNVLHEPAYFPTSPDAYGSSAPSPSQVPRSTSLSTHPIGPRMDPPIRSKTDADRVKYKQQQELLYQQQSGVAKFDPSQPDNSMALDLPTIPAGRRKKFNPAKLSSEHFKQCTEPWALSSILAWVRDLSQDETDLKEQAIVDAIVALFTHKVPTMNIADAETLADMVVKDMLAEEALVKDEEWVKFSTGSLSGVLFQITDKGCYSSRLHEQETEVLGRCYSHHCMRTLKKVNLKAQVMEPQKKVEDWVTFYKVPKEVWESYPKKEVDRQNNLHEIVTTEDAYIGQLDVLRELYRDPLATMQPSIIPPKRLNMFLTDVFGKADAVKRANEEFLLAQLKYRQREQGPFIAGFSDIFREWIRKAKAVYIAYAATFPSANYLIRKEAERNPHFRQFLNQAREHKLSNRLSWDTYLKAPITRIQRYTLLLSTVHKNMLKDCEEKTNLAQAIEEIKLVALECDNKVGETSKKVDLMELSSKLQLRPKMKRQVELNLEHLGREIIYRGDLQRQGMRTRFLVETHAILFDHYFVLAKSFDAKESSKTVKYERYDVSKLPIPMDLLMLESTNDDPVVKSSVRGVSSISPPQALMHVNGANSASSANSTTSGKTLVPSTVLENSKDDRLLYPFKVTHLGKNEIFVLYASSAQNRQDWCEKIILAKTKHAAALYAQNAEPFRLRVLADTAFGYSDHTTGSKNITIKGTPLDRAIKEVERQYPSTGSRPLPICRTSVHCATVFQQPAGRMKCAVGTDYGVYISDYNDPRGWVRVCDSLPFHVTGC